MMTHFSKKLRPGIRGLALYFLLSGLFIFPGFVVAQKQKFEVEIKFKVNEGNMDDTEVLIIKDGGSPSRRKASSKMMIELDFQHTYIVKFTKPGFITKSVEINTNVPESNLEDGFEVYDFEVKLFKQYEGVNIVVFNQPVGKIRFSAEADDFDYDTDYTKSILSQLKLAEEQLEIAAEEASAKTKTPPPPPPPPVQQASTPPPPATTPPPPPAGNVASGTKAGNQDVAAANKKAEEDAAKKKKEADDEAARKKAEADEENRKRLAEKEEAEKRGAAQREEDERQRKLLADANAEEKKKLAAKLEEENQARMAAIAEAEERKRLASREEEENRRKLAEQAEADARAKLLAAMEEKENRIKAMKAGGASESPDLLKDATAIVLVSREVIEEPNRTINRVTIKHGPKTVVYNNIRYNWGGEFYFRDWTAITAVIYDRQTNLK